MNKSFYELLWFFLQVIETHCTLIVSPETIVNQWIDEIKRHIKHGAIKYLVSLIFCCFRFENSATIAISGLKAVICCCSRFL